MSYQPQQPVSLHRSRRQLEIHLLQRSISTTTITTTIGLIAIFFIAKQQMMAGQMSHVQQVLLACSLAVLISVVLLGRRIGSHISSDTKVTKVRINLLMTTGIATGLGGYSLFGFLSQQEQYLCCLVFATIFVGCAAYLHDSFDSLVVVWLVIWVPPLMASGEPTLRLGIGAAALGSLAVGTIVHTCVRSLLEFMVSDQERLAGCAANLESSNYHLKMFFLAANHDLAQPLTAIQFGLRSISELTDPRSPTKQHIEMMLAASQTLSRLIGDIVHYEKVASGVLGADSTRTPLQDVLDRIVSQTEQLARTKNIGLWCRRSTHHLTSDAFIVERIVRNLVENAIKNTSNGKVLIAARPHKGTIRIEVWDTGRGIEPAAADRVFDLFYQNMGSGGRTAGHGVGLTIVRTLAQKIGADIEVKTRPGHGSVFKLVLSPDSCDTQVSTEPRVERLAIRKQPRPNSWAKVLVAVLEDNEGLRAAICTTLAERGATVIDSGTTRGLLEKIGTRVSSVDILLTDWNLGSDTGESAANALRSHSHFSGTWIVISGDISESERRRLHTAGVTTIDKPCAPEKLVEAVEIALSSKRAR